MKLAIDAGHGMGNRRSGSYDPGAVFVHDGVTYAEADFNLQYALAVNWFCRINVPQIEAFLVRTGTADSCPVGGRRLRAKAAGCTHFISLHVNSASKVASGMETLYRSGKDLAFAQLVHDAVHSCTEFRNRGLKERTDLAVLKFDGPACLVELGFINNAAEVSRLSARGTRVCVAQQIVRVMEGLA